MGYHELPSAASADGYCGDALQSLTQRMETVAGLDPYVLFVAMADVVSPAQLAAYDPDGIHPSAGSSREIGTRIANAIRAAQQS